jgi:hypothetical protein
LESDRLSGWLTWEALSARLAANGVDDITERQLERWRNEGVFPAVQNVPLKFQGSVTYYPPNSCEQALEIRRLLGEKDLFAYVGWELWWRGFWVGEIHWKLALEKAASQWDRYLGKLKLQIAKDEKSNSNKTIFDRAAQSNVSNIVLSRLRGRVEIENLATVFRVILETATGQFRDFEPNPQTDVRTDEDVAAGRKLKSPDEIQLMHALDFVQSEADTVLGKKFQFSAALLPMLRDISTALRTGKFSDVCQYSNVEIEQARTDLRNAMKLAITLYEAKGWIYGRNAFGLRLMAWVAKKATPELKCMMILCWVKLRRVSIDLYPSAEIASLTDQVEIIRHFSQQLRQLAEIDGRFASVLTPKRIRKGLNDQIAFQRFLREIKVATMP